MILVTGSTGLVGRELVKQLQAAQVPFRALAHSPASAQTLKAQGVRVVEGDYTQPSSLAASLDGADRLFLLTPTNPALVEIEQNIIGAAKQAGVQHIVKLSALDVDRAGIEIMDWHAQSENNLRASGLPYTILRPNYFLQNFARIDAPTIIGQGAIYSSLAAAPVSAIDTRDIAAVALAALTTDRHFNQTYDLTGSEAFTFEQAAARFSKRLNKPVQFINLPDDQMRTAMIANGVPDWYADGLVLLFKYYREGKGAVINDNVARITGQPARTFDTYLNDHLHLFKA